MRFKVIASIVAVVLLSAVAYGDEDDNKKKREKSRKMATQTLQDLYKLQPTTQAAIQKSAGYAVFNNMGTNLLIVSTARGSGIAVNPQMIDGYSQLLSTVKSTSLKLGSK